MPPGSAPLLVVHVSTQRGWRGGEQQALWLHERLARRGVRQRLVCAEGSALARRAALGGAEVIEAAGRGGLDPRFGRAVARASAGALVHAHDPNAHAAAVMAATLFRAAAPIVVARRVVFPIGRGPLSRWKYDHRQVRRIICGSLAIAETLRGAIRRPERLRVVHDAIDPARFAAAGRSGRLRAELGVPPGVPLVGTVAALAPEKDPLTFAETAARLLGAGRDVRFVWVGEGRLRHAMAARLRALGIADRVTLTGFREDVAELLPQLDLFLFTSAVEGLGTSLLDAQVCRVPVVATAAGGIREAVLDGETGLLAPPGDAAALADRVARLLDDPGHARRLVEAAERRVHQAFGIDALADRTLEIYREVMAERGGGLELP